MCAHLKITPPLPPPFPPRADTALLLPCVQGVAESHANVYRQLAAGLSDTTAKGAGGSRAFATADASACCGASSGGGSSSSGTSDRSGTVGTLWVSVLLCLRLLAASIVLCFACQCSLHARTLKTRHHPAPSTCASSAVAHP